MVKVVYTVLLGNYKLNEPICLNPSWEHICYTNQNIKSKYWNIIKINGDKKMSRKLKIMTHKITPYDICLYLDAKFTIKANLDNFVANNLNHNFAVMKHNKRNCLYDEGNFCIKIGNEKKEIIQKQLKCYKNQGMPKNFGLYAPGIMIKKNTPEINNFMNFWYGQVDRFSYRDIISFSYTLWKNPINFNTMPFRETYELFTINKNS